MIVPSLLAGSLVAILCWYATRADLSPEERERYWRIFSARDGDRLWGPKAALIFWGMAFMLWVAYLIGSTQ